MSKFPQRGIKKGVLFYNSGWYTAQITTVTKCTRPTYGTSICVRDFREPTGKNMYGAARNKITKINLNIKWMRININFEWSNLKNRPGSAVGFQSWAQGKVKESKRPTYDWSMGSSFTSADTHDIRRRSSNSTATRAPVRSGRKSLVIMQNSRREESNFSMQMVKFPLQGRTSSGCL